MYGRLYLAFHVPCRPLVLANSVLCPKIYFFTSSWHVCLPAKSDLWKGGQSARVWSGVKMVVSASIKKCPIKDNAHLQFCTIVEPLIVNNVLLHKKTFLQHDNWATAWQNQQNDMCSQQRLRLYRYIIAKLYAPYLWFSRRMHKPDLSLCWACMSFCWFCCTAAQLSYVQRMPHPMKKTFIVKFCYPFCCSVTISSDTIFIRIIWNSPAINLI